MPVEVVDTLAVSASRDSSPSKRPSVQKRAHRPPTSRRKSVRKRDNVHLFGAIDTLEYLRRGGRIGGAQALLGTMLKVKPVISLEDGVVEPVGRVRTRAKALEHMVGLVREHKDRIGRLIVLSGDAPDTDKLVELLQDVATVPPDDIWTLGAIVGAHAGPGVIGVAFVTRPDGA